MSSARRLSVSLPIVFGGPFALLACAGAPPSAPAAVQAPATPPPAPARDRLAEWFPALGPDATREDLVRAVLAGLAEAPAAGAPIDPSAAAAAVRARMHAAIERGDFERARDLLSELVARGEIERGRALLGSGDARGALSVLDRGVALFEARPVPADARLLHGEAALRVGLEGGERDLCALALSEFQAVATSEPSSEAWLAASRAARALGKGDDALEYARNAQSVAKVLHAPLAAVVLPASGPGQRVVAEASTAAYFSAQAADPGTPWARSYFVEARAALEALAGRTPDDPWTWNELARVHEAAGELADAERVARTGLKLAPCDAPLCATLARVVEARAGRAERIAAFDGLSESDPECALGPWYAADGRFADALERNAAGEDARALFSAAERGFARARTLESGYDRAAREREAACRAGVGWAAFRAGDLDAAQSAFLAMEDLFPGAVATEVPEKLGSGVLGLDLVGAAYAKRGEDVSKAGALEDLERAGRVYEFLRRAQPDVPRWANNAGFFRRDAAIALHDRARALAAADPAKHDEATRMLARAQELAEESWTAYAEAARLAPDDVRVVNDAALVLVYYLQRDVDRAKALLEHARAVGEERVAALRARAAEPNLAENEREQRRKELEELESALGDVYQNLGVIALTLDGDARAALPWLERCLTAGPDPREEVRGKDGYLERCKRAIEDGRDPKLRPQDRWDAPLPARAR
ncbi:MAG: hypothetical protein U1F29_05935 [Planctomycetota bacterium]